MDNSATSDQNKQEDGSQNQQVDLTVYNPQNFQAQRDKLRDDLEKAVNNGTAPTIGRFLLACLSAVPGVGGAIGGVAGVWSEKEQTNVNDIFVAWLKLQEDELREIGKTLFEVIIRLDKEDVEVIKRIESPEYLGLIRKAFRNWSAAESEEKRILIRNLLSNAGSSGQITSDDVLGLFIDWIDNYSEAHFTIVKSIYNNSGITRRGVWEKIHGQIAREDSAEADLFKLLISDLSQGHIIRQHRETDYSGSYVKSRPARRSGSPSQYTSAFDDEKRYELTELGMQFVHYTMNEIVPKLRG